MLDIAVDLAQGFGRKLQVLLDALEVRQQLADGFAKELIIHQDLVKLGAHLADLMIALAFGESDQASEHTEGDH